MLPIPSNTRFGGNARRPLHGRKNGGGATGRCHKRSHGNLGAVRQGRFSFQQDHSAAHYAAAGQARPDSWIPPYNLACLRAVGGEREAALAMLEDAVERGFASSRLLVDNDDFDALRAAPEWPLLMAKAEAAAARSRGAATGSRRPR